MTLLFVTRVVMVMVMMMMTVMVIYGDDSSQVEVSVEPER